MPIYEYACDHCGHHLEVMQRISDEALTKCPECQKDTLVRLVSAAGFRLKGGGWYETDFKDSDKKRNLASSESEAPKNSDGGSGGEKSTDKNSSASSDTTKSDSGTKSSGSNAGSGSSSAGSGSKGPSVDSGSKVGSSENKKDIKKDTSS